jgi:hypothetical protein
MKVKAPPWAGGAPWDPLKIYTFQDFGLGAEVIAIRQGSQASHTDQVVRRVQALVGVGRLDAGEHGSGAVVSHSIRKPRSLPETKCVGSIPVSWMPGTVSPRQSIQQRLDNQARANSIALVAAHYDDTPSPLVTECGSPLVLP